MNRTGTPHPRPGIARRLALSILLAVICSIPPATARAQIAWSNPLRDITTTTKLSGGDLRVLQRVLGLDAQQRTMLDDLRAAWLAEFTKGHRTATAEAAARIDEALVTGRDEPIGQANDIIRAWNDRAEELEARFVEDIRSAIITSEQDALWPIVERELRRIEQLPRGRLVGEQIDLTRLIDEIHPGWPDDPEIIEALHQYAERIDEPIRARMALLTNELSKEYANKVLTADGEAAREIYDRVLIARQRVQRTNESHRRTLAALLPDEALRRRFDQAYIDASLRTVFPPFAISRRIDAVRALPTLTPEQRRTTDAAIDRYSDLRAANRRSLFESVHHSQSTTLPNSLAKALAPPSQGGGLIIDGVLVPAQAVFNPGRDERVDAAREALLATERQLLAELLEPLTPEQRLALPLPDQELLFLYDHRDHGL
ncbi:MAG: hypothetical protein ACTS3F_03710 [Phycisphaerales bacterium]